MLTREQFDAMDNEAKHNFMHRHYAKTVEAMLTELSSRLALAAHHLWHDGHVVSLQVEVMVFSDDMKYAMESECLGEEQSVREIFEDEKKKEQEELNVRDMWDKRHFN